MRVVLAALLLPLAGCGESPQEATIESNAAALQARLEAQADNMEAMADAAADRNAAEAIEDASDRPDNEEVEVPNVAESARDKLFP